MVVGGSAKYKMIQESADVLATINDSEINGIQNYWQSFQVLTGEPTTCLPTTDLNDKNPSLFEYTEKYFEDLENYQKVSIDSLENESF